MIANLIIGATLVPTVSTMYCIYVSHFVLFLTFFLILGEETNTRCIFL